jgi:hypothetical protein
MSSSVPCGALRASATKRGTPAKPGKRAPQPRERARSLPVPSGHGTKSGRKRVKPSERSARTVEAIQLNVPSPPKQTSSAPCAVASSAASAASGALGRHRRERE